MRDRDIVSALKRLKVETGSVVCLGCGYEHNCSTKGCRILREAADVIEELSRENESLADTVNKADEIIKSRGGKWISAKEQLPEVGKRVLTLSKFGHCFDRTLREHNGGVLLFAPDGFAPGKDVTHWMPLPEPPKE